MFTYQSRSLGLAMLGLTVPPSNGCMEKQPHCSGGIWSTSSQGSHHALLPPALRLIVCPQRSASPQSCFSRRERRRLGPVSRIKWEDRPRGWRVPQERFLTHRPQPLWTVVASLAPVGVCLWGPLLSPPGPKPPLKSECASLSSVNSPWTCSSGGWTCSRATLPP